MEVVGIFSPLKLKIYSIIIVWGSCTKNVRLIDTPVKTFTVITGKNTKRYKKIKCCSNSENPMQRILYGNPGD